MICRGRAARRPAADGKATGTEVRRVQVGRPDGVSRADPPPASAPASVTSPEIAPDVAPSIRPRVVARSSARPHISIVYSTARAVPRLDWLMDDLSSQCQSAGDRLELIIVDALGRPAREIGYRDLDPVVRLVETLPKHCPWQGAQRVTSRDWWAMSNARNTGIALATAPCIVFLDDRCHLGDRFVATIREWARGVRSRTPQLPVAVLAGAYEKRELGPDGRPIVTPDGRLVQAPEGRVGCGGDWLYGCAVAAPLSWLLEVNGFEEGVDGLSGEDYLLGLMLANRGRRIDYVPDLFVSQDRTSGHDHRMRRTDKGVSPDDKSHAALARFGSRTRTEFTPDLRVLRARIAAGLGFPGIDPRADLRDWYDGQPIREMT